MDDLDYLTDAQKRLLFDIVEASRSADDIFLMIRTFSGEWLQHAGFSGGQRDFAHADAIVLRDLGLLTVVSVDKDNAFHFVAAPQAFAAYEELHHRMGEAVDVVEKDTLRYFESQALHQRHPDAMASWDRAADLVWSRNADARLSDVGHHCRLALQEFAESLLRCMGLEPTEPNKEKTRDRASQALMEARERGLVGETMEAVLNALFHYWVAICDLACKQEHAANREAAATDWEDARALVFQSLFVMTEFDRRLCR